MRASIQTVTQINIVIITSTDDYAVGPLRTSRYSSNPRTTNESISKGIMTHGMTDA